MANRIIGLPPPFLLVCFIFRLTLDIHCKVQALQPLTLVQAIGLARLQEEKFLDHRQAVRPRASFSMNPTPFRVPPSPLPQLVPLLPASIRPPPLALKRLTSNEIASRRERRLCFTCDEKYHRGHCCASRVFLLIIEEDEPPASNIDLLDLLPDLTRTRPKSVLILWRVM